jgi:Surface-adhesin protein E
MSSRRAVTLVVIGLIIFSYEKVWGQDWRLYHEDGLASYYYDAEKIVRPSKNMVRVWSKVVYTKEGATGLLPQLGKEFKTLGFSIDLSEFNCANREYKELQRTFFSRKATYLGEQKDLLLGVVIPGTAKEKLFRILCK